MPRSNRTLMLHSHNGAILESLALCSLGMPQKLSKSSVCFVWVSGGFEPTNALEVFALPASVARFSGFLLTALSPAQLITVNVTIAASTDTEDRTQYFVF